MPFKIKPLTPELIPDYMDFFANRAFSDGSRFYPCHCCNYNMPDAEFWSHCEGLEDTPENRFRVQSECAELLIRDGRLQGYLAYDGDMAVGWCNANDKSSYVHFGDIGSEDAGKDAAIASETAGKTKSVVCFEVAPDYRRMGIAKMLLCRVVEDARRDGFDFVEAYPQDETEFDVLQYTGPMRFLETFGFERAAQHGDTVVMRKKLN